MKILIRDSKQEGCFDIAVTSDDGEQVFESETHLSSMVEDRAFELEACYDAEIKWDIKGLEVDDAESN